MSTHQAGSSPEVGHDHSLLYKDVVLDRLAEGGNVAQFVSFGPRPDLPPRYSRVRGYAANHPFSAAEEAIEALLSTSVDGSINVRSFHPAQPKSNEFIYGLHSVGEALGALRRLASAGLNTIANETVDVHDGGISGVAFGGIVEFAPDDTPRCVESPGTTSLPFDAGMDFLTTVFGFRPSLDYGAETRVEFSLHPVKRGFRHEHTIVWEVERVPSPTLRAAIDWPNHFSRFVGDKAFGLLVGDMLGVPVPRTIVISRRLAPFAFGTATKTGERWIRTCPVEQVPGRFTTARGWKDPFALLQREDPEALWIASVLSQEGVDACHSGALVVGGDGRPVVEGVTGTGESFMAGTAAPEPLPKNVVDDVLRLHGKLTQALGPSRMEWVHDGARAWMVQLHRGAVASEGSVVYPGETASYERFDVGEGLEALRDLISSVKGSGVGIILEGQVGLTSHFGDLLRRAQIPSRIKPKPSKLEGPQSAV